MRSGIIDAEVCHLAAEGGHGYNFLRHVGAVYGPVASKGENFQVWVSADVSIIRLLQKLGCRYLLLSESMRSF